MLRKNLLNKKFIIKFNEAPLANASGIFSTRFVGAKSTEAENSSHSSTDLRPRFSAKADKSVRLSIIIFSPILLLITAYNLAFKNKIFPGIYVAQIEVGGLKTSQATGLLSEKITPPTNIILINEDNIYDISTDALNFSYDFDQSAKSAYKLDRSGNILFDLYQRLKAPYRYKNIGLRFKLDEESLEMQLKEIALEIEVEPQYSSIELVKGQVIVNQGSPGTIVDLIKLRIDIGQNIAFAKNSPINIVLSPVDVGLKEDQAEILKLRAQNILEKNLILIFEDTKYVFKNEQLFSLLAVNGTYDNEKIKSLIVNIEGAVNRNPQNPIFIFEEERVKEFAPAKDGVKVKTETLQNMIVGNLRTLEALNEKTATFAIPVELTPPKIKTGDINDLGIEKLIGKGKSLFAGSIASRIYNINLASSKFNGVLVAPGEVFSFNDTLGDVSGYTGYKQAYIIKDGKTVLGDGGGVCQVSTTLFRAALNAGLSIIERRAHSYRVSYYEQDSPPGLDATVFAPTTDLKFKNDTPGHLLIQTRFNSKDASLVFEIYGTNDGRVVEISKPVVTSVTSPPEDLYQDDPTLPAGTIKQIDFKAWGAKVSFNYMVKRGDETIFEKTFYSNFRPWQAVFLRGTGPVN